MFGDHTGDDSLGFLDVIAVADAEEHIDAAGVHAGDVGDGIAPDLLVGDEDFLVVEGEDGGGDHADAIDLALDAADLDCITDIEGAVDEQHESGGEIAEGVLKGEGEDECTTADEGERGADIYPDGAEGDDQADGEDDAVCHLVDEGLEQSGEVPLLCGGAADELSGEGGEQPE